MKAHKLPRMTTVDERTNPIEGQVKWSPVKSLWWSFHAVLGLVGGVVTFSLGNAALAGILTVTTLCLGHTVGLHRLLIHRSFNCPLWMERFLVYVGTLVGMGGPFRMLYQHDIRDWAQRHPECHPFFTDTAPFWQDARWQLHCELRLANPPLFRIEEKIWRDGFYRWLQKTWMLQQVPLAALLFNIGGWGAVIWGISVRIVLSVTGHWLVGWLAHNVGERRWHLKGHAVQGYNIPLLSWLTMGEAWHNNHHAFPDSAQLGLEKGQTDPGWLFILLLKRLGLASEVTLPRDLAPRPELSLCTEEKQRQDQKHAEEAFSLYPPTRVGMAEGV